VHAHLTTFSDRPGPDGQPLDPANDSALLTLQFANGAQGTIHVGAMAYIAERNQEQRVVLHGSEGTIEIDFDFHVGYTIRAARQGDDVFQTLTIPDHILQGVDTTKPMMEQVRHHFSHGSQMFIRAIVEDRPVSSDFAAGLKVVEIIDAAVEADRRGCWVTVGSG
jgi:predicted dehydrogenase